MVGTSYCSKVVTPSRICSHDVHRIVIIVVDSHSSANFFLTERNQGKRCTFLLQVHRVPSIAWRKEYEFSLANATVR